MARDKKKKAYIYILANDLFWSMSRKDFLFTRSHKQMKSNLKFFIDL